jgi:hypothetical protein
MRSLLYRNQLVRGIEFFFDRLDIQLLRRPIIEINGNQRQIEDDDYEDLYNNGTHVQSYLYYIADLIEHDSDGDVTLQCYDDHSTEGVVKRRCFLEYIGKNRVREYIRDAMRDVLLYYQLDSENSTGKLQTYDILVRDRTFF